MAKSRTKSAGRFGPRYGRKDRKAVASIEEQMRMPYRCPQCGHTSVSRIDAGIWRCVKCKFTFAGGTYVPQTPAGRIQKPASKAEEREHGV